jgi:hypothetical protein
MVFVMDAKENKNLRNAIEEQSKREKELKEQPDEAPKDEDETRKAKID